MRCQRKSKGLKQNYYLLPLFALQQNMSGNDSKQNYQIFENKISFMKQIINTWNAIFLGFNYGKLEENNFQSSCRFVKINANFL